MTGLAYNSTSLAIGIHRLGESGPIRYDADLSANIEGITTIGTYAAPTSGKVRFGEVGGGLQGFRGWYEVQFAAALFAATNDCRAVAISVECPGSGCHAGLYLQLRPQKADLARIDGEANAEATLQLKAVIVEGTNDVGAVVQVKNNGWGPGLGIHAPSSGSNIDLPAPLSAPDVASIASWNVIEGVAFLLRVVTNKMEISKANSSITLFKDDGTTELGSQTITDDGETQTRGAIE